MKKIVKKYTFMFMLVFCLGLLLTIISPFILPKRFFYDTEIIIFDTYNEIGWIGSYPFSIMFYKITLLKNLPFSLIGIIQYTTVMFFLYKIGIPNKFHIINAKNTLMYIALLLLAIYMCMPSKEFINFIFITILVRLLIKSNFKVKTKIAFSVILMIIFACFFRPYYFLIPIIAFGMSFIVYIKLKNKVYNSIFYGLLIAILLSLSSGLIKGEYLSQANREELNSIRTKDNNSMIVSPIKTNTLYGESTGIIYGFFSVNLPLEGFKFILNPQIIAFVIWQILLFYILLIRFSKAIKNHENDYIYFWILLLLFAYFIVQGIFEPDLGSAIRHKMGVFPLIYIALYYENFRNNLSETT